MAQFFSIQEETLFEESGSESTLAIDVAGPIVATALFRPWLGYIRPIEFGGFCDLSGEESTAVVPPSAIDPPFPPVWPYPFSTAEIYGREHFSVNIKMVRGDDYSFTFNITLDGAAVDLTGATLRFTAKWAITDGDGSAVMQRTTLNGGITVTDAVNGVARLDIIPSNTTSLPAHRVDLPFDLQLTNSASKVYTVLSGTLIVVPDASVTTP